MHEYPSQYLCGNTQVLEGDFVVRCPEQNYKFLEERSVSQGLYGNSSRTPVTHILQFHSVLDHSLI